MNNKNSISEERKQYLRRIKKEKIIIKIIQFSIVLGLVVLWEMLANNGIIDSFIMSSPSRIIKTFLNLSQNNLVHHIGVTCTETIVGFSLGTIIRKFCCCFTMVVKPFF